MFKLNDGHRQSHRKIGDCDQSTQLITCSNIRIESSPAAVAMASVTGDLIKEKYLRNVDYKLN